MPQHKNLPDSELHEVKGAATANAGYVLTADGVGSASFQPAASGGGVFGNEFMVVESLAAVTTTSANNWQNKISAQLPSLVGGKYRVAWHYQWSGDSTGRDFMARMRMNGADLPAMAWNHRQEPKDSSGASTPAGTGTDQQHTANGVRYLDFVAGDAPLFELDLKTSNNGIRASMWNAVFEFWRVS